ncbi:MULTISPECIES: response regulator [Xanthomonas]|uniref:Response regulator n=1 Tax=Xanthomonas campestris pv. papavericola TaxID=487881 RepID=A0AAJ2X601_XANCA|nr:MULTISPECIES: response regulator [Xanthomonas]MCC5067124.1 response regulator [Xanthomonas campestris]MCC5086182.1 response regulator [Xanthomonas campestris]MCW2003990.1 DNA-binding response OmpR family regulator [Xanthomonas campestris]MCW2039224.1 DNA-binding response OmpR family regulator [Xanthomonas campestris]MEA0736392.1 response regulator [Xanthomonas campestris pv. campestris]
MIKLHSSVTPTPDERAPRPGRAAKVLVVDDDHAMAQVVVGHIRSHGMEAFIATNSSELAESLRRREPDILLLDLMLKHEDGLDLLRALRKESDIPVIIMTGHRRDEIDRVVGLELGADDYLPKPFGLHELTARIRAVLRRHTASKVAAARGAGEGCVRFNEWEFNLQARTVERSGTPAVPLTKGEYALLRAFVEAPGRPLSRDHLMRATRLHEDVFDRSIDVQILRLRRKLEQDPSDPKLIVTQRGAGYIFTPSVDHAS